MASVAEAIKLPFTDGRKLLIGTVLGLGGVLATFGAVAAGLGAVLALVLGLFTSGYSIRLAQSVMKGKFILPEWTEWGDLFVKGLIATIISLIWFIPTLVIGGIALGSAVLGGLSGTLDIGSLAGGALFGAILTGLVGALTLYLLPSAIFTYAKQERFGAGFDFGTIAAHAFSIPYFVGGLLALGLIALSTAIEFPIGLYLQWTYVVPGIVSAFLGFAIGVAGNALLAEGWSEA